MDEFAEEKTTEQNLFVHSGQSEADVTNNKRWHSRYHTAETNYRQTRSIAWHVCNSRATSLILSVYVTVNGKQHTCFTTLFQDNIGRSVAHS